MNKTVAFITGAGQGLGRATAIALAASGTRVAVLDRVEESARNVVREIEAAVGKGRAIALVGDVSCEKEMSHCIAETMSHFGQININVNCAGIAPPARTLSRKGVPHSLEQFARVMNVNVIGTFNCIRLTAEQMQKNEPDADGLRGVIINTASVAAFDGQIGQAAYASSKGAVAAMTLPVARDLSSIGVRVCTIAPGLFLTPMLEGLPEQVQNELASTVPFPKRLGRPNEYAMLVKAIIENPMMNGEVIRLDGALRMQP
jgi:3-hydroxyacyl-CoA dehydrogenase/3-hydroxy-2-methylbutyryl-CoA dehydrogenase